MSTPRNMIAQLAGADTIPRGRTIVDNRGRRDKMDADQIDRFAATGNKGVAPAPSEELFAAAIAQLNQLGEAEKRKKKASLLDGDVTGEQNELMQMALMSMLDPDIDANDVGSQMLQGIAMDTLGPQQTTVDSPGGMRNMLGGILQNMFAANEPKAGGR